MLNGTFKSWPFSRQNIFILVQCSTMGGRGIQNPERSWILLHGQYILKHFVLGLIDTKNYLNVTSPRGNSHKLFWVQTREGSTISLLEKIRIGPIRGNSRLSWMLDCTPWIPDFQFRYWIQDLCQWNLDSGFHSLVGFRVPRAVFRNPKPKILCSKRKSFPDCGFHKQTFSGFPHIRATRTSSLIVLGEPN